jgi:guanine deaminase
MNKEKFIDILIAEDNEVSREMMAGILRTQGFRIHGAADGEAAIRLVAGRTIDVALVDINMAPKGGFEFVRHLVARGIRLPVIIITSDDSSDILTTASALGVTRVLQKPVDPGRLIGAVQQILRRQGINPEPLAAQAIDTHYTPATLMDKAIALADRNAKSGKGGPFGAVVADAEGKILGEGVSGVTSRADPTAHAEVMAIRQAAEKLGRTALSGCVLYCSSEPTMMGKSLILSVGIEKVYFGLSHAEVSQIRPREKNPSPEYIQMRHGEALAMFKSWQAQPEKVTE